MVVPAFLFAALIGAAGGPCREGEHAYLGIHLRAGAEHVEVEAIDPESPASGSGLAPGDQLVAVNGVTLTEPGQLAAIVASRCPGQKIILKSRDGYGFRETSIVLEVSRAVAAPKIDARTTLSDEPRSGGWYGWKVAVLDGTAITLTSLGVATETGEIAVVSVGAAALGPPIIHLTHDNRGRALGSLALRIGLPAVGAFMARNGFCGAHCNEREESASLNIISLFGGAVGFLAASLIDIFALSWDS